MKQTSHYSRGTEINGRYLTVHWISFNSQELFTFVIFQQGFSLIINYLRLALEKGNLGYTHIKQTHTQVRWVKKELTSLPHLP